jgi:beta-glucosidase/6-phospho-beta-glucosidase/beta-galactosidase
MQTAKPQATYHFTKGFLWGCATAAHQVEGGNIHNDWWAWEQQPGRILNGDQSGMAADWWGGRWREDFDRAAENHHNAHRLSVEWSRIQPAPDRWDEQALDVYREMVKGLQARGMTPMVTLWHFTLPVWVAEQGGWENEATIGLFEVFVRRVVEALKPYVSMWVTVNEPNNYANFAYLAGAFPPGRKDLNAFLRVMVNLVRGHAAAYRAIHAIQPQAQVGWAIHYRSFRPAWRGSALDGFIAKTFHQVFNNACACALLDGRFNGVFKKVRIPEAKNTQDFFGLNYYSRELIGIGWSDHGRGVGGMADFGYAPSGARNGLRNADSGLGGKDEGGRMKDEGEEGGLQSSINPKSAFHLLPGLQRFYPEGAELGDRGFNACVPEGLFEALGWARQFKCPIMITENGIEDKQDDVRRRYLVQHLHQVWRGVNYAWPIRGYFHWTLVDNFEWERGWTQRFGLYELDCETQARRKRKSADLFAAIIAENGISSDVVAQYTPELFEVLFPK